MRNLILKPKHPDIRHEKIDMGEYGITLHWLESMKKTENISFSLTLCSTYRQQNAMVSISVRPYHVHSPFVNWSISSLWQCRPFCMPRIIHATDHWPSPHPNSPLATFDCDSTFPRLLPMIPRSISEWRILGRTPTNEIIATKTVLWWLLGLTKIRSEVNTFYNVHVAVSANQITNRQI